MALGRTVFSQPSPTRTTEPSAAAATGDSGRHNTPPKASPVDPSSPSWIEPSSSSPYGLDMLRWSSSSGGPLAQTRGTQRCCQLLPKSSPSIESSSSHEIRPSSGALDQSEHTIMYPTWSRAILKFFSGFTTQVRVRRDLSRRIKTINTRLESIVENKGKYKIEDGSETTLITTWRPSTAISSTAEKLDDFVIPLMGRTDQLADLGYLLISKVTEHPMVISVTGKSGVGKTKLVKERYEESATKRYFDVMAWVTCAPNLSASNIMKLILLRLLEAPPRCPNKDLGVMLQKELANKKYLLVIDGEVSSTDWSNMFGFLRTDISKSRIVRITQATDLEPPPASWFESKTIKLDHFGAVESAVSLFLATLFMDDKDNHCSSMIEKDVRGKRAKFIYNVTDGLPLAIVLLSGLLRTKEYPGEWDKVFKHLKRKSNESKRFDNILSMCFDDLPHDLKSCFLYFAGFPASTLVKARTLVCEWMAEGFLRPKEGKSMEKVGEWYLRELIHRRMMNLPPLEDAAPGDERVSVQARVHEFLVLEAQEANFVEIHIGDDLPSLSTARRLSLQNHRDKYAALADPLPKLRSIMSNFEKEDPQDNIGENKEDIMTNDGACSPFSKKSESSDVMRKLLQRSRFLRVIYLDGLEIGKKLPSEIGNVVHLHYLGITSCSLDTVPPSVGKLTRLQTLDVRGSDVTRLPSEFWKIRTLRHIFGSIILPRRVGNLEHLQTLQAVKPDGVGGSCWDATTFASMKRLQSLYIWGLTAENVNVLVPVYSLKYLMLLSIGGDVISMDLFAQSSYTRLRVMVLKGEIVMPPLVESSSSKSFYFPTLTKLSLKSTKVSQDFIDKLSLELPLLASLALLPESCEGKCLSLTKGFQSLKELKLDVDLKEIIIIGPACLGLEKLEISMYSGDLHLQVRPQIKEIIKLHDKFLHDHAKISILMALS